MHIQSTPPVSWRNCGDCRERVTTPEHWSAAQVAMSHIDRSLHGHRVCLTRIVDDDAPDPTPGNSQTSVRIVITAAGDTAHKEITAALINDDGAPLYDPGADPHGDPPWDITPYTYNPHGRDAYGTIGGIRVHVTYTAHHPAW